MAIAQKYQGFKRVDSTTNPLGIYCAGQKRMSFGNAVLTQEGDASGALLLGGGTDTTPAKTSTADSKFISFYSQSAATSGDARGIYNKLKLSGAGGGGESLRTYTDVVGVTVATAHGAHISLGFGESTTGAKATGLAAAVRATLGLPSVAMGSGGTYAAVMSEIYSFGASADPAAVTELSFIKCTAGGDTTGAGKVDDKAYLLVFDGGATSSGNVFTTSTTEAGYAYSARCKVNGTDMYMMFSTNAS